MFYKKNVPKNFTKFAEKLSVPDFIFLITLRIFEKVFKKETMAQMLSCEICEIFKNTVRIGQFRATASVVNLRLN